MYKLLALDLDGTLIGRDLTISPRTKSAISRLMSQGIIVTIGDYDVEFLKELAERDVAVTIIPEKIISIK